MSGDNQPPTVVKSLNSK